MNANAIDSQQLLAQARIERERVRAHLIALCGEARGEVFLEQLLGTAPEPVDSGFDLADGI